MGVKGTKVIGCNRAGGRKGVGGSGWFQSKLITFVNAFFIRGYP